MEHSTWDTPIGSQLDGRSSTAVVAAQTCTNSQRVWGLHPIRGQVHVTYWEGYTLVHTGCVQFARGAVPCTFVSMTPKQLTTWLPVDYPCC